MHASAFLYKNTVWTPASAAATIILRQSSSWKSVLRQPSIPSSSATSSSTLSRTFHSTTTTTTKTANKKFLFQQAYFSSLFYSTSYNCCSIIRSSSARMSSNYSIDERGAKNSGNYRIYYRDSSGKPISPWHDIPLFADKSKNHYNMIVEIPRWTQAKMEISTGESLNPIKQDVKKGNLRFVHNVFPHKGYIWNYGAFPQTWENPGHIDPSTQAKGDNDPIDVIEIGSKIANRGDVVTVKILGTIALIDEGETDWKVITIDVSDPVANDVNNIGDIEKHFPGLLRATVEWFKIYKIPDGKPPNEFAFKGEAKDKEFAEKIVQETHEFWKELINKPDGTGLDVKNTTLANSHSVDEVSAKAIVEEKPGSNTLPPEPIANPMILQKWHFVRLV